MPGVENLTDSVLRAGDSQVLYGCRGGYDGHLLSAVKKSMRGLVHKAEGRRPQWKVGVVFNV